MMSMNTRSKSRSVQSTERVASSGAHSPRRVLRTRHGNAGVIMNLVEGSTSYIVALGETSESFTQSVTTRDVKLANLSIYQKQ